MARLSPSAGGAIPQVVEGGLFVIEDARVLLDPHLDLVIFLGLEGMLDEEVGVALHALPRAPPQRSDGRLDDGDGQAVLVVGGPADALVGPGLGRAGRAAPERIGPDVAEELHRPAILDVLGEMLPHVGQEGAPGDAVDVLARQGRRDPLPRCHLICHVGGSIGPVDREESTGRGRRNARGGKIRIIPHHFCLTSFGAAYTVQSEMPDRRLPGETFGLVMPTWFRGFTL
ncbi:MAG: hypothetical protein NT031_06610 [Planctomycetota bacterium]|nr:hypothetical protein [Planctomycetota bacterium]